MEKERKQKTENRSQMTEDRGQKTEDGRQRTEDRGQKTEGKNRSDVQCPKSNVESQEAEKSKQEKEMVSVKKKEYQEIKRELEELREQKDKFIRSMAEYENARKRIDKEKLDFLKFANEKLINDLLPIIDDFERAINSAEKGDGLKHVVEGIKMIKKQLLRILKSKGLERIEAKYKKFDPNIHEAIGYMETDKHDEDTVVEVLQTGYLFKDRLLRPAVVRVAKTKGEEQETKDDKRTS